MGPAPVKSAAISRISCGEIQISAINLSDIWQYVRVRTYGTRARINERRCGVTDKLKIRVEYEQDGPLKVVRPHRFFHGKIAVAEPLYFEVEWEEHEDLFGCMCDESEGLLGRAARSAKVPTLLITPDPLLYGTDDDRTSAGKLTFKRLKFGEWNVLNLEEL